MDLACVDLKNKLAELVPEIADGRVEVMRCASVPGFRTKIVVRSTDDAVDPVGAVVGPGGVRIRAVVAHLRGDAIDVIPFYEDPVKQVQYVLAPATIRKIYVSDDVLELVVPDEDFDRVVGPDGKHLAMAANLVGLKLDVFRASTMG